MTAVIDVRDAHVVHKARGAGLFTRARVHALTGADFSVAAGETVGVVGESGCGKSTLAKVLVGIQRPVPGTVAFRGRELWAMPGAERRATVGTGIVRRMSDRVITMYLGRIVEETPADRVTDAARHPYTRALFSATPGLLDPLDPIPLTGPVPSATRPPSGCPFRTRCWKADAVCAGSMPDFSAASRPGHRYRCHHPVEEDRPTRDLARQSLLQEP
ncbi:ABC transporter ATP-binding protein [Streptomyces sp. FXJ1.172]|uniref:oligopeptide/dipeptide ABC transporter ATP-binding protein n=1 Tax=Streptomyces sp. FXJ1.172 TaxID=710705 RepID=UPI0007CF1EB7|nr:ABC transporter ATP-binding protein [Streptomyces sp. FXJ1.172]WEO97538.1 ABC transporter ATP-binding protein [Streptomyces sp. FXJ1.172]